MLLLSFFPYKRICRFGKLTFLILNDEKGNENQHSYFKCFLRSVFLDFLISQVKKPTETLKNIASLEKSKKWSFNTSLKMYLWRVFKLQIAKVCFKNPLKHLKNHHVHQIMTKSICNGLKFGPLRHVSLQEIYKYKFWIEYTLKRAPISISKLLLLMLVWEMFTKVKKGGCFIKQHND